MNKYKIEIEQVSYVHELTKRKHTVNTQFDVFIHCKRKMVQSFPPAYQWDYEFNLCGQKYTGFTPFNSYEDAIKLAIQKAEQIYLEGDTLNG